MPRHHDGRGPVRPPVVGVREPEGDQHRRGHGLDEDRLQRGGDLLGGRDLEPVLVVGEVEPHRRGADARHGLALLLAPGADDVVAVVEAAERVPPRRLLRVPRRASAEDGDDGRTGMGGQQLAGREHGVVEVR